MEGDSKKKGERSTIAIIREVYESPDALEIFEFELDHKLEAGYDIIVIEPTRLGDETARWIAVGNCLHKTATLSGLGSFACAFLWTDKPYLCASLCAVSLICTGVHTISWQFDPCVNYQVQSNVKEVLTEHPLLEQFTSSAPVVLVRKEVRSRNILHSSVSLIAAVVCVWRLYEAFK